ncbi:MAG: thioredoxin family protein [Thermoanaerobaculales bacterium]|nr:thioredoxin family protein [Thermoanaerobaculales bacterium]
MALDKSNFDHLVLGDGITLIDCWAPWCQGCRQFDPVFDAAAERHPSHTFAKLNTQAESELTDKLGIKHIPTLILFRDGILLLRQPGHAPAEALDEIVEKAEGLDMDQVRAAMEEETSG